MKITQLLFFIKIITFLNIFPMDCINKENYFKSIPHDLLPMIIVQQNHEYPWENFIHIHKLKNVCKTWHNTIGDHNKLAQSLNIPAMHCAAMMNNPDKIIELKLSGHSPLAPDAQKLIPMNYALACSQSDALIMLRIGLAVLNSEITHQYDKKIIKIIQKPYTKRCSQKEINKIIADNDYQKAIIALSNYNFLSENDVFYDLNKFEELRALGLNNLANLFLYTLQCILEAILFNNINRQENISQSFYNNFITAQANPNAYNTNGSTPLLLLARKPSLQETLHMLLKLKNININLPHLLNEYNAICVCASTGNKKGLKLLLKTKKLKKDTLTVTDSHALNCAIENDHNDCVKLLLQNGAIINTLDTLNNFTPVHYAAMNGNTDILRLLINASQCSIDMSNSLGITPLMIAIQKDQIECVNLLISHGADSNLTKKNNDTLMHIAAFNNAEKCLRHLLFFTSFKHQINKHNYLGYTPLINATRQKHFSCVKLLIDAQANIHAQDKLKQTALHFAAAKGCNNIITLLIGHGAYVNCTSAPSYIPNTLDGLNTLDGFYTPLHFAAEYGHTDAVKILITNKADISLRTQLGKTALDLACTKNHTEIIKLLS